MLEKISDKLTNAMLREDTIQEESKELYSFGIQQGLFLLIGVISFIFIGWCFGMVWQALLYLVFYMPIRIYAGGYHAPTQKHCYVFSCAMLVLVLAVMKIARAQTTAYLVLTIVAGVILFLLAPVEDKHKPLDEKEEYVYRKRAYIAISIELLLCLICVMLRWKMLLCICSAVITNAGMTALGYMVNKSRNTNR